MAKCGSQTLQGVQGLNVRMSKMALVCVRGVKPHSAHGYPEL